MSNTKPLHSEWKEKWEKGPPPEVPAVPLPMTKYEVKPHPLCVYCEEYLPADHLCIDVPANDPRRSSATPAEERERPVKQGERESGWRDGTKVCPPLVPGQQYSENVLAVVEGYETLQVMNWYAPSQMWCNCYGDIHGGGENDDNYNVLLWQPLPTIPSIIHSA